MSKEKEITGRVAVNNNPYPPYLFNEKAYEEFKVAVENYTKSKNLGNTNSVTKSKDSKKTK